MHNFHLLNARCLGVFSAIPILLLLSFSTSQAQSVPGGAESGRIEQRFEDRIPSRAKPRIVTGLESTTPPSEAAATKLKLNNIIIDGSTVYDQSELNDIYAELIGQTVSLAQIFDVAAQITARYGQDGYVLSRAIVPPQALSPGGATIRIQIIEGYVDEVQWPEGLERFHNFFDDYAEKIIADRPLNIATLERYLLLANDLPGLSFQSSFTASHTNTGASTLVVTVTKAPFDGYISADNHGVEASGPYQATILGALNNIFGAHERIEAAFTIAGPSENDDRELGFVAWKYQQVLTSEGLTFFFEGNTSDGDPGTAALLALGYKTNGLNVSTGMSFPFIRTRSENLTGTIAFDFKNSESTNLGVLATKDRLRIIRGELSYDKADDNGGVNQITLVVSKGIDGLGSTSNSNPLASRTPSIVDFTKATAEISRTQKLQNRFSFFTSIFGQWTNDPLLSSQECGYGGRNYGRGFDSSIITGDKCFLASAELRHNLNLSGAAASWLKYAQPYAFIDYGHIWNINAPLGTPASDDATSAGAGIRFGNNTFSADLTVSTVINAPNSQPNIDDTRGWFKTTFKF